MKKIWSDPTQPNQMTSQVRAKIFNTKFKKIWFNTKITHKNMGQPEPDMGWVRANIFYPKPEMTRPWPNPKDDQVYAQFIVMCSGGHLWAPILDDQVYNELTRLFAYDLLLIIGFQLIWLTNYKEGMFSRGMSAINRNDWSSLVIIRTKLIILGGNKVKFLVDIAITTMFHIWLCHRKTMGAKSCGIQIQVSAWQFLNRISLPMI